MRSQTTAVSRLEAEWRLRFGPVVGCAAAAFAFVVVLEAVRAVVSGKAERAGAQNSPQTVQQAPMPLAAWQQGQHPALRSDRHAPLLPCPQHSQKPAWLETRRWEVQSFEELEPRHEKQKFGQGSQSLQGRMPAEPTVRLWGDNLLLAHERVRSSEEVLPGQLSRGAFGLWHADLGAGRVCPSFRSFRLCHFHLCAHSSPQAPLLCPFLRSSREVAPAWRRWEPFWWSLRWAPSISSVLKPPSTLDQDDQHHPTRFCQSPPLH